jgi:hypothetical protein
MHAGEVLRSVVVCEWHRAGGHQRHLRTRRRQLGVDNNIWLVGDDKEVIVIDAAHDARPSRTPSPIGTSSRWCAPTATTTTSPSHRS